MRGHRPRCNGSVPAYQRHRKRTLLAAWFRIRTGSGCCESCRTWLSTAQGSFEFTADRGIGDMSDCVSMAIAVASRTCMEHGRLSRHPRTQVIAPVPGARRSGHPQPRRRTHFTLHHFVGHVKSSVWQTMIVILLLTMRRTAWLWDFAALARCVSTTFTTNRFMKRLDYTLASPSRGMCVINAAWCVFRGSARDVLYGR